MYTYKSFVHRQRDEDNNALDSIDAYIDMTRQQRIAVHTIKANEIFSFVLPKYRILLISRIPLLFIGHCSS